MVAGGFTESETTFDLDNLPASVSDKAFSLTVGGFGSTANEARCLNPTVKLAVVYELGNSSTVLYNAAIASAEWVIGNITNRNLTGGNQLDFTGATARMDATENFLICEFTFDVYYQ